MNDNLIYDLYSYAFKHDLPLIVDAADEIKQLRKERDEARQSVCKMSIHIGGVFRRVGGKTVEVTTAEGVADMMGWDCFKEEADHNNNYFKTHHK